MPQSPRPPAADARTHRALAHVTRVRIMQLLDGGPAEVQALAEATGLHPNTVRQHLDILERAELVTRLPSEPTGPGRPPIRFGLPPRRDPRRAGQADAWLLEVLVASVRQGLHDPGPVVESAARSLSAGRTPAPAAGSTPAGAVEAVVALLDELGFDPELGSDAATGTAEVRLRRCPFDDLARRYGDIVCTAHLGMVRGALEELGATVTADLRPFVEPALCLVDLSIPAEDTDPPSG